MFSNVYNLYISDYEMYMGASKGTYIESSIWPG